MTARLTWLLVAFWLAFAATGVAAQEATAPEAATATDDARAPLIGDATGVDYAAWNLAAERAEGLVQRNQASPFALDRLRAEVGEWRDVFAQAMTENAGRLTTLDSQIAALGPEPAEGATEAASITVRRTELIASRDALAAPGILAAEAHARASGLLREAESQLRDRQTAALMERTPSPLNPAHWLSSVAQLWTGAQTVGAEVGAEFSVAASNAQGLGRIIVGGVAIIAAIFLFLRGPRYARTWGHGSGIGVASFLAELTSTIAQAALPLLGLFLLTFGISSLDLFGPRAQAVWATVPLTGSVIILSGWLARQFFPSDERYGPLRFDPLVRVSARRTVTFIAWVAALWLPFDAFLSSGELTTLQRAVLTMPIVFLLATSLWRFGRILRNPPSKDADPEAGEGRARHLVGRFAQGVGGVSLLLAVAGFGAAAETFLFATVLSLGLLGIMIYLQVVAMRFYGLVHGPSDTVDDEGSLIPVVIAIVLIAAALPLLALIWGARVTDLTEMWLRFTEGFAVGETRISPSNFLTFVGVFGLGYFATQFIKTTLANSVLPRTRLDLGARNAAVAGFGYFGIFLSAIFAITTAGIDLSNLAIVAGALSVGIGFGLQTIVSNFVSGIILLVERPISQGDWIEVGSKMGYVRDISVRATRIETFDQTDVIIPNEDLISTQVINWTRGNLVGRLILPIGVGYGTDPARVSAILREIAEMHPMVTMTPPPAILFMKFGADALEFEIRAILRDVNFVNTVRSEMNHEIARRFAHEGIEIPFAQRDIWLRNPEVLGHAGSQETAPQGSAAQTASDTPERPGYDTPSRTSAPDDPQPSET